jgi:4-hydroxybenzoate polyprenyltransferase
VASAPSQGGTSVLGRALQTLEFIKFSHTIFALPFALVAMLTAARGLPPLRVVLLILACMAAARTAAMAFNRIADWEWDKLNPRTANRSRLATKRTAWLLVIGSLIVFVAATQALNPLCFALAPAAIALVLGYSLTKRFTAFPHFFLGLALGAAPMGAWAAVRGELADGAPWALMAAVLCWVFGFDLIYATLDVEFDRRAGVHSFPARHGIPAALRLAGVLHIAAWGLFLLFGRLAGFGLPYWIGLGIAALALVQEQRLSRTGAVGPINAAFFQVNAVVGLTLLLATAANLWLLH